VQSTCPDEISFRPADVDLRCYACGGSRLRWRFSVPLVDGPYQHDKKVTRRSIYQCDSCGHLSADLCDPAKYADYYASLSDDYHVSHDHDQSRYRQILGVLPKSPVKRVLDIGCGTGTFLAMLPPEMERFGIEPSRAAADRARDKGIRIVQYDDLDTLELHNSFDLVTVIDVVEHTKDLEQLRRQIVGALRPGGTVIILTGDADSRSARLLGPYWLYLNYAEHVTFFCRRSMQTWLQSDLSGIEVTKTDHEPLNSRLGLSLLRVWLLFPVKWLLQKVLPVRMNFYAALCLPRDHMLVRAVRTQTLTQ